MLTAWFDKESLGGEGRLELQGRPLCGDAVWAGPRKEERQTSKDAMVRGPACLSPAARWALGVGNVGLTEVPPLPSGVCSLPGITFQVCR